MEQLNTLYKKFDVFNKEAAAEIERLELETKEHQEAALMSQKKTLETLEELHSNLAEKVPGDNFVSMRDSLRRQCEQLQQLKDATKKEREEKMLKKDTINTRVEEMKLEMSKLFDENKLLEEKLKSRTQGQ